jgi:uncharacterized membrane protein
MGKLEYLDALKRAMLGLPPEVQARTLADYEQRFVDGEAAGRDEQEVGRELDDPKKIALGLRTSAHLTHLSGFEEKKNPANLLRMLVSGVGLAIFNLFMIVPAMVYSSLLLALYVCALAFYLAGIATTASGLAGTNELVLDWPGRLVHIDDGDSRRLRVEIGDHGINIHPERSQEAAAPSGADDAAADEDSDGGHYRDRDTARDEGRRERSHVLRGAETVADGAVHITTGMDAQSRTTQTLFGFGMVLGGIALSLLSLVITRYTVVGLKRYLQMNWSLLRGNGA